MSTHTMTEREASSLTMYGAVARYRAANDAGNGYELEGETRDDAAALAVDGDKSRIVLTPVTTSEVYVVRVGDTLIAIGSDAMGRNPWACDIGTVST